MQHKRKAPVIGQDSRGLEKGSLARQNQGNERDRGNLGKFLNIFQGEACHGV